VAQKEKTMQVILNRVPHYFQRHLKNEEWRKRGATIACLKMAMDYIGNGRCLPNMDELFEESETIRESMLEKKQITEKAVSAGLLHDIIVWVAHNHGIPSHREEYKSVDVFSVFTVQPFFAPSQHEQAMTKHGLERIRESIAKNSPVIVSIHENFAQDGPTHSILLVGFERCPKIIGGFYYRDPASLDVYPVEKKDEGINFVALTGFLETWRRTAIFIDSL
jgi:hypothetical protein